MARNLLRCNRGVQDLYEVVRVFQIAAYRHFASTATAKHWPFTPVVSVGREGSQIVRVTRRIGIVEEHCGSCCAIIRI